MGSKSKRNCVHNTIRYIHKRPLAPLFIDPRPSEHCGPNAEEISGYRRGSVDRHFREKEDRL